MLLHLRHAYHHIDIKPEDRHKTAFRAPDGLWEWNRMAFGFINAPAAFQRMMDIAFGDIQNVLIYLDDLLIVAETEEEMLNIIRTVFERISK